MSATPDSPADLEGLEPFDSDRVPTLSDVPEALRLEAATLHLVTLADFAAEIRANASTLGPDATARQLTNAHRLRADALDLVKREALRAARRELHAQAVTAAGDAAREAVRRAFERDPDTDPEDVEYLAHDAAVTAALAAQGATVET